MPGTANPYTRLLTVSSAACQRSNEPERDIDIDTHPVDIQMASAPEPVGTSERL